MGDRVKLTAKWSRRFRTYWCVVDGHGRAYLVSARLNRSKSISAWLADADKARKGWRWWKRIGYTCQRADIKIRSASLASNETRE
jgi:hypothetical protein